MQNDYARLLNKDLNGVVKALEFIIKERKKDLQDFINLKNVFISGRKVAKIPTGASDTTGNRVGDFNYDASYIYICIDNSGTAEWRRATLASW